MIYAVSNGPSLLQDFHVLKSMKELCIACVGAVKG